MSNFHYTRAKRFDPVNLASNMSGRTRIWRVIVAVLLIAAVTSTMVGVVCHSHVNCSPSTCPLCHMVIAPSLVGIPANVLILLGARPESKSTPFVARTARQQLPARAPPA